MDITRTGEGWLLFRSNSWVNQWSRPPDGFPQQLTSDHIYWAKIGTSMRWTISRVAPPRYLPPTGHAFLWFPLLECGQDLRLPFNQWSIAEVMGRHSGVMFYYLRLHLASRLALETFLAGVINKRPCWGNPHRKKLRVTSSTHSLKNWSPQSESHKEKNSADNLGELEIGPFRSQTSGWDPSPCWQRNCRLTEDPFGLCLDFWPTKLWDK